MGTLTPAEFLIIVYVATGLVFLGAAVYLQVTRSLAISNARDHAALAVQYNDFKLQTFYPVVALFVIAFACTIVFPLFLTNLNYRNSVIRVTAPVRPKNVHFSTPEQAASDDPVLLVYNSGTPIRYELRGDNGHDRVILQLLFDSATSDLKAELTNVWPGTPLPVKMIGPGVAEIETVINLPKMKTVSRETMPRNALSQR